MTHLSVGGRDWTPCVEKDEHKGKCVKREECTIREQVGGGVEGGAIRLELSFVEYAVLDDTRNVVGCATSVLSVLRLRTAPAWLTYCQKFPNC